MTRLEAAKPIEMEEVKKARTIDPEYAFDADSVTLDNFEGYGKARKKPVVITFLQMNFPEGFKVTTKEGVTCGKPGDYLMWGIKGEKYPCDREIFEASYDIVGDEEEPSHVEPDASRHD